MSEVVLAGCRATPLASYLKALGVLRLLASKYPETRAGWSGGHFVVNAALHAHGIVSHVLNDYVPTPVIAPWNGGSGFYYQERKSNERDPKTGKKKKLGVFDQETAATRVVDAILSGDSWRLAKYREALRFAKDLVTRHGYVTAPKEGEKARLILILRASLPEDCLEALDACLCITNGVDGGLRASWQPMLGTGGNDGNLDFTNNFMQRLVDVLGVRNGTVPEIGEDLLRASLFGATSPGMARNNIGQFSPGNAGGPNSSTGFAADALINPWDFVLMIEGALTFAAAAVRRNADDPSGTPSFPFAVRAVGAGSGSLSEGDASRGELWLPRWRQAATYAEVRGLMAEGRVALGKRPARDALDFVRSIHRLGSYRGVHSFQRFGILKRNGDAHLATPLMQVHPTDKPAPRFLDDLESNGWLDRFRQFARGDSAPQRLLALRRQLEDLCFDLSDGAPNPAETQTLLILLGGIQHALSSSAKARDVVAPIPRLTEQWIAAAADGTPEFRIATALAGLRGVGEVPLPLRSQLFPVQRQSNRWSKPEDEEVRLCIGRRGRLISSLGAWFEHRLWLMTKLEMPDKPLGSPAGATLHDVAAFVQDPRMDSHITALLPGLSLCEIPPDTRNAPERGTLPAALALMKLALSTDRDLRSLGRLAADEHLPVPAGLLPLLRAGNPGNRATGVAWRRLRASGLTPAIRDPLPALAGIDPARAAAALLIPLRRTATAALTRVLLDEPEETTATPSTTN